MELRPHHPRRPRPLPLLIVITLISDARDVINHWNRRVATARAEFTILDRVKKVSIFKRNEISFSLSLVRKNREQKNFQEVGERLENYSKTGRRRTERTEIPYRSWCIALLSKSIEFLEHTFLFCLLSKTRRISIAFPARKVLEESISFYFYDR